jgi:hypothetical protein
VTKEEYEASKLTGAETALLELLDALLQDSRMTDKEKKKKLAKFKEAYPAIWRYIILSMPSPLKRDGLLYSVLDTRHLSNACKSVH